ncbi:MAG: AMP-binding protein, partial [Paracoccaceae bacterium]
RLLQQPGLAQNARGMRLFISGSAPLLDATHKRWEALTGHVILERYGMTETSMNTSNPYDGERRAGTVGFPLPLVELRVVDGATGEVVEPGERGMIEVRGPNLFSGYWQMPEKTSQEMRKDGFLITGDIGRVDDAGYLSIVGRARDMIITGGLNVYPKEIERVIDGLDGVLESAVIGVPHPDLGEAVVAVVVAEQGAELVADAIADGISDALAGFKRPKEFVFVQELARNTMGKVQKNILREQFAGLFA